MTDFNHSDYIENIPIPALPNLENPKFSPPSNCLWLFDTLKESEHLTRTPRFLNSVPRATVSWLCDTLKESELPCHISQLREVRLQGTATAILRRERQRPLKLSGWLPGQPVGQRFPCCADPSLPTVSGRHTVCLTYCLADRLSGTNGPSRIQVRLYCKEQLLTQR